MAKHYAFFTFAWVCLAACGGEIAGVEADGGRIEDLPSDDGAHDPRAARMADALVDYRNRCHLAGDWYFGSEAHEMRRDTLANRYDQRLASDARSSTYEPWLTRCAAALETSVCHLAPEGETWPPGEMHVSYGAYFYLFGPPECANEPMGTRDDGETCSEGFECKAGICSDSGSACGRCGEVEPARVGAACTSTARVPCEEGAACVENTCVPIQYVADGEACSDSRRCQEDSYCSRATTPSTCAPAAAAGELCELAPSSCQEGLKCERFGLTADQSQPRRCIVPVSTPSPPAQLGEPCGAEVSCHTDLRCDGESLRCAARRRLGERCAAQDCADGLWCDPNESMCAPRPGEGQPCPESLQNECAAGLACAEDGVCHAFGAAAAQCR